MAMLCMNTLRILMCVYYHPGHYSANIIHLKTMYLNEYKGVLAYRAYFQMVNFIMGQRNISPSVYSLPPAAIKLL